MSRATVEYNPTITVEAATIIRKHLGDKCRVFLFGSRVDGSSHFTSDYDIGILCDKEVPQMDIINIKNEIENMRTLYKIDVVDFRRVSNDFYEVAMEHIFDL